MEKNIAIVHYNTPRLTECLVMSINKFVEDAKIYIFDNSDKYPFTKHFENVTILDNTKGQIVNFDEWLKKYPNRSKSPGRVNLWGSAKHAYSVEICMQKINKPFMLMDSDILLTKNIDDLFNNNYAYVAETITQPLSSIKRVLPFLCYINTKMLHDNNIHYFNDNMMHGLRKTPRGDYYDTGASLHIDSAKLKHKDIKLSDYILHFGHGSWNKRGDNKKITAEEWLVQNKNLWLPEGQPLPIWPTNITPPQINPPHPQNKTPKSAKTTDLGFWANLDY